MNRMPKIGERVKYAGGIVVGPCTGTVMRIFPAHDPAPGHDEEDDDCQYVQAPFDPKRWSASVEVDKKPDKWCYGDTTRFAPDIADIEAI